MDLVDDEPPHRRKDLSRCAGEDEVQRLWSGDEDVGRVALHRAAHLGRGVAGADGRRDVRRHPAATLDLVADAHQRRAQVAVDVVGESLQRRYIKDATALRLGGHGFRRQAVDAPQEGSQGLPAPGGCGHQDVAARGHLAPASFLDLTRLGVSYDDFANNISAATAHDKPRRGRRVVPTMAVKRTVELAFGEADRMNSKVVDTAHLLLGLALQGEGMGPFVLQDMGTSAERIVAEVEDDLGVPLSGRGKLPTSRPPWTTDLPEPPEVIGLRDRLASVRFALKNAAEAGDTEHALKLGREENRLEGELGRARRKWQGSLG